MKPSVIIVRAAFLVTLINCVSIQNLFASAHTAGTCDVCKAIPTNNDYILPNGMQLSGLLNIDDGNQKAADQTFVSSFVIGGTGTTQVSNVVTDNLGNRYVTGGFSGTIEYDGEIYTSTGGYDFFLAKLDTEGHVIWVQTASGSAELEDALALEGSLAMNIDDKNDIYVGGSFVKSLSFKDAEGNEIVGLTDGRDDDLLNLEMFIAKYDSDGSLLWAIGGESESIGSESTLALGMNTVHSISIDEEGYPYVAGAFSGTNFFGEDVTVAGESDFYLASLEKDGEGLFWVDVFGTPGTDYAKEISVDSLGYLNVLGVVGTGLMDLPDSDQFWYNDTGNEDTFIISYDVDGEWYFASFMGAGEQVVGSAVGSAKKGDIYVSGFFSGEASFVGSDIVLESMGFNDGYLVKYDLNGDALWAKQFGYWNASADRLVIDEQENILVMGRYEDKIIFDADTESPVMLSTESESNLFLAKFDSLGTLLWAKNIEGTGAESKDLIYDESVVPYATTPLDIVSSSYNGGEIILTGDFNGTLTLDETQLVASSGNRFAFGAVLSNSETTSPEAADGRVLASNLNGYVFVPADFAQSDNNASIIVKTLPANGDLELDGAGVSADVEISVGNINDGDMIYMPNAGGHGVNYDTFDFKIKDSAGTESTDAWTMTIDVGAQRVELTGGEGWRFLGNPSDGDNYDDLLGPVWTKGIPGSDSPGALVPNIYTLNQTDYEWRPPASMNNATSPGQAFIVYIYSDNNNNGTPDDFPKTLTSGENWLPLDGSFSYSGLGYNESASNPDNFYLIANPRPVSVEFCEFTSDHVANSVDFWDPGANGGNGDYMNVSCAEEDVFIAPFQAFWVRTTEPNPALEIPEEAYKQNTANGYFKQQQPSKGSDPSADGLDDGFLLTLNLSDDDGVFTNTARILFSEEASTGLDLFDAPKLSPQELTNRWLSFYSLDRDNKAYAFQSLPLDFDEKIKILLDIKTTEAGRYTLDWTLPELQVFSGNYFLRDNVAGEVVELMEGNHYHFEIGPDQTVESASKERSAKSPKDFADLTHPMSVPAMDGMLQSITHRASSGDGPRFELLVAAAGIDGMTELGVVPEEFALGQNYPNPFNPTTVISFQLPALSQIRLEVYDMIGRRVATLVDGQAAAGRHTINFDASGLSSGVYLYRLQARSSLGEGGAAGSTIMTRKLTVVK